MGHLGHLGSLNLCEWKMIRISAIWTIFFDWLYGHRLWGCGTAVGCFVGMLLALAFSLARGFGLGNLAHLFGPVEDGRLCSPTWRKLRLWLLEFLVLSAFCLLCDMWTGLYADALKRVHEERHSSCNCWHMGRDCSVGEPRGDRDIRSVTDIKASKLMAWSRRPIPQILRH